jgi:hypothetical protein
MMIAAYLLAAASGAALAIGQREVGIALAITGFSLGLGRLLHPHRKG